MEPKDFIYAGVGMMFFAKERMERELEKLMEQGKISKGDMENVIESAKVKGLEADKQIRDAVHKIMVESADEVGLATKKDIEDIKKMIEEHKH